MILPPCAEILSQRRKVWVSTDRRSQYGVEGVLAKDDDRPTATLSVLNENFSLCDLPYHVLYGISYTEFTFIFKVGSGRKNQAIFLIENFCSGDFNFEEFKKMLNFCVLRFGFSRAFPPAGLSVTACFSQKNDKQNNEYLL